MHWTVPLHVGKIRRMGKTAARQTILLLVGSAFLLACGPSIDKAAKADIDQRIAALAHTGQTLPAPTTFVPKPLAVGQWTQYKLVNDKGEPALVTYKIVGEDNGAFWVEIANESYFGKTVMKILLFPGDRMNPNTMEVRAVKMKDKKGQVTEMQGPMLQLMKSMWQSSIDMLAVSWQGLPQESMPVIAGTFVGCFKARTDASWGMWHSASMTWMHSIVPISGLVKSAGIDRPTSMELVGFGETGATSEIP
jgi:hypothetical protein